MTRRDKIKKSKELGLSKIPMDDAELNIELRTLLIEYALTKSQKQFFGGNITKLKELPYNTKEGKEERIKLIKKALKKNNFYESHGYPKQDFDKNSIYALQKRDELLGANRNE